MTSINFSVKSLVIGNPAYCAKSRADNEADRDQDDAPQLQPVGDTNAWAIRMLAAAQKFLIQLNRKTTEFYRTAVVRANEADLPPAGVQAGLRGLFTANGLRP